MECANDLGAKQGLFDKLMLNLLEVFSVELDMRHEVVIKQVFRLIKLGLVRSNPSSPTWRES